jgi:hypothetical protein
MLFEVSAVELILGVPGSQPGHTAITRGGRAFTDAGYVDRSGFSS